METAIADSVVTTGRYGSVITADATNNGIPERIEIMRAGNWPEQNNKGRALEITQADLKEFADNFKAGIGVPGGKDFGQIPIDFSHDDDKEAAGWITDLVVDGDILYASVNWTTAGRAALEGGMYKCISPSFWPACLGVYPDPENHQKTARNVLVGAGLTNIPFFKDLKAIMASKLGNKPDELIKGDTTVPTFDEVRIKDVASLTDDDKKLLADNRDKLSDAEQTKFADALPKVEAAAKPVEASQVTGISDEDKAILASVKNGEVKMIKAAEYDSLTATVNKLEADNKAAKTAAVKASVEAELANGRIVASEVDRWTDLIVADENMAKVLEALPAHKIGAEIGASTTDGDAGKAMEAAIKAKMDADKSLDYAAALTQVANEDGDLANSYSQQIKK